MTWLGGGVVVLTALLCGAWLVALMDAVCLWKVGGVRRGAAASLPLRQALQELRRQNISPEAPDAVGRYLAPAVYFGLAGVALALVPVGPDRVLLHTPVGIVVWGAVETLTIVAVFLHGWSQNSLFPLMGGYRFVALGLSAMLLSMFVLIGTALPAESLALVPIVESQRALWNVVRQPLGLPLFLLLGLAISLREPMNFGDSADLAGGTSAEDSGPLRAAWQLARTAMLTAFAAVAASAFLGGYLGPFLPGALWLVLKTLVVLVVLVALSHVLARPDASRALTLMWTVLLPLAFLDLAIAGLESLP